MLTKQRRIILTLYLYIFLKLLSGSLSLYKQAFIALINNSSKKKKNKGHVLTLPQEIQQLADALPRAIKDLPYHIYYERKNNRSLEFKVRRKKVESALLWLIDNNPLHPHVTISNKMLKDLPEVDYVDLQNLQVTFEKCSDVSSETLDYDAGPDDSNEEFLQRNSELVVLYLAKIILSCKTYSINLVGTYKNSFKLILNCCSCNIGFSNAVSRWY